MNRFVFPIRIVFSSLIVNVLIMDAFALGREEESVEIVMEETGCSCEEARIALKWNRWNVAMAIRYING